MSDTGRDLLRHTLATLAYRGGKALRDVPESVGRRRVAEGSRTPLEILAHVNDLLDWGLALCRGEHRWRDSTPTNWAGETARFHAGLATLDAYLVGGDPLGFPAERIFQGPIADALAHVGQIAYLRRLGGSPVRGENYFQADIVAGRVGPEQTAPVREFD
ncbi:MAG: hypothetical protein M3542_05825 [Acidobacteriota bacterium]|nr:hypothetical protein [Acidobacteriota bacterium]